MDVLRSSCSQWVLYPFCPTGICDTHYRSPIAVADAHCERVLTIEPIFDVVRYSSQSLRVNEHLLGLSRFFFAPVFTLLTKLNIYILSSTTVNVFKNERKKKAEPRTKYYLLKTATLKVMNEFCS